MDKILIIHQYGILSFAKNIGTHATKVAKNLINKFSQKLDSAKKSTVDAIETASKRTIKKTAEATGDLIGNTIADKSHSETSSESLSENALKTNEIEIPREIYIS